MLHHIKENTAENQFVQLNFLCAWIIRFGLHYGLFCHSTSGWKDKSVMKSNQDLEMLQNNVGFKSSKKISELAFTDAIENITLTFLPQILSQPGIRRTTRGSWEWTNASCHHNLNENTDRRWTIHIAWKNKKNSENKKFVKKQYKKKILKKQKKNKVQASKNDDTKVKIFFTRAEQVLMPEHATVCLKSWFSPPGWVAPNDWSIWGRVGMTFAELNTFPLHKQKKSRFRVSNFLI